MLTASYFDLLTSAVFPPGTASTKSAHFYPVIPDKARWLRITVLISFFSLPHVLLFRISLFSLSLTDLHWEIIAMLWLSDMEVKIGLYSFIISCSLGTYHLTLQLAIGYTFSHFNYFCPIASVHFQFQVLPEINYPNLQSYMVGCSQCSGFFCLGFFWDYKLLLMANSGRLCLHVLCFKLDLQR